MSYASWSVVFGEQPSAAKWNILGTNDSSFNDGTGISNLEVGSGHTSVKNDYKFSVYRSAAATSASTAGGSLVPHDTKVFDTSTNIDVVTNKGRFTAPVAGFYWFAAQASNTAAASTQQQSFLFKNGSVAKQGQGLDSTLNGGISGGLVTGLLQLSANDYVEHFFIGGNGSTMAVGQDKLWFDGILLSQT